MTYTETIKDQESPIGGTPVHNACLPESIGYTLSSLKRIIVNHPLFKTRLREAAKKVIFFSGPATKRGRGKVRAWPL